MHSKALSVVTFSEKKIKSKEMKNNTKEMTTEDSCRALEEMLGLLLKIEGICRLKSATQSVV